MGDLVAQLHAVGHDHERPVARHLAQHLSGGERKRRTVATVLPAGPAPGTATKPLKRRFAGKP